MATTAPVRGTAGTRQAGRRTLFWLGIGMSVVAFLLVLILGTVVAGRSAVGTTKVNVVVAAQDISRRTVIKPTDLTISAIPVSAAPPGTIPASASVVGKVAQVNVLKGQPVTANLIASRGTGDPAYLPIPQGWVGYTVQAGELKSVGGYVSPGDVIDIEGTVPVGFSTATNPAPPSVTRVFFPGIHVIRVGPGSQDARSGLPIGVTTSFTVLMTACDAPYLTWLLNSNAGLTYTLRSVKDYPGDPSGPDSSCPAGASPPVVTVAGAISKFGIPKS
jgi:Flp pilus assembly protein CpaB